jgi:hypothetical protein
MEFITRARGERMKSAILVLRESKRRVNHVAILREYQKQAMAHFPKTAFHLRGSVSVSWTRLDLVLEVQHDIENLF